jgi:hypothetical protein
VPFDAPKLQLFCSNKYDRIESLFHPVLVKPVAYCLEDLIPRKAPFPIPPFARSTHA